MHEVLQTYLTVMYNDTIKMADALPLDEMLLHRMKYNYTTIMEKMVVLNFVHKLIWKSFINMVY